MGSLFEHQSCYKQHFKFLAVREPNFLEPKIHQNRPLTGFCMYIGPASVFFLYLDLSSVLCRAVFPMYLVSPIGLPAYRVLHLYYIIFYHIILYSNILLLYIT